jgi:hypothetical protein
LTTAKQPPLGRPSDPQARAGRTSAPGPGRVIHRLARSRYQIAAAECRRGYRMSMSRCTAVVERPFLSLDPASHCSSEPGRGDHEDQGQQRVDDRGRPGLAGRWPSRRRSAHRRWRWSPRREHFIGQPNKQVGFEERTGDTMSVMAFADGHRGRMAPDDASQSWLGGLRAHSPRHDQCVREAARAFGARRSPRGEIGDAPCSAARAGPSSTTLPTRRPATRCWRSSTT